MSLYYYSAYTIIGFDLHEGTTSAIDSSLLCYVISHFWGEGGGGALSVSLHVSQLLQKFAGWLSEKFAQLAKSNFDYSCTANCRAERWD